MRGILDATTLRTDFQSHLETPGQGFTIVKAACDPQDAVDAARLCDDLPLSSFRTMFNDMLKSEMESAGILVPTDLLGTLQGQPPQYVRADGTASGGRVMRSCGQTVPAPPKEIQGADLNTWVRVCTAATILHGQAQFTWGKRYHTLYGPSLLRSFGECPAQLGHIDSFYPANVKSAGPALSFLLALSEGPTRVVVYPHSHRCLPASPGGAMTQEIEPVVAVLQPGDVLVFRQDLVHHGAASSGTNHRLHWYADAGRPALKENIFRVYLPGERPESRWPQPGTFSRATRSRK